jgi:hypothetical protein
MLWCISVWKLTSTATYRYTSLAQLTYMVLGQFVGLVKVRISLVSDQGNVTMFAATPPGAAVR